jgi:hypothetical protein
MSQAPDKPQRAGSSVAKRTSALMVRVTDEQRRLFEERAAMSGLSTSAWARMILLRESRGQGTEK